MRVSRGSALSWISRWCDAGGRFFSVKNNCMSGATLPQLMKILWTNRAEVHWFTYSIRILFLFAMSLFNSFVAVIEWALYSRAVAQQELNQRPIFILGHPRTGTTLIHNILGQDSDLAFASTFHVAFPSGFITLSRFRWLLSGLVDKTRPMDAMPLHLDLPGEDEIATTLLSGGASAYMPLFFMRRFAQFLPLLTLDDALPADAARWEAAFLLFLRKVTYATGGARRRLVIKSPVHTSRVPHLLRLFPRAQFIYVHRDPRAVLQSALHLAQAFPAPPPARAARLQRRRAAPRGRRALSGGRVPLRHTTGTPTSPCLATPRYPAPAPAPAPPSAPAAGAGAPTRGDRARAARRSRRLWCSRWSSCTARFSRREERSHAARCARSPLPTSSATHPARSAASTPRCASPRPPPRSRPRPAPQPCARARGEPAARARQGERAAEQYSRATRSFRKNAHVPLSPALEALLRGRLAFIAEQQARAPSARAPSARACAEPPPRARRATACPRSPRRARAAPAPRAP